MTTEPAADAPMIAELGGDARLNRGGISWAIFEGGRDPYVILMTIYIFMPYVSASMVGDSVKGQGLIAQLREQAAAYERLGVQLIGVTTQGAEGVADYVRVNAASIPPVATKD